MFLNCDSFSAFIDHFSESSPAFMQVSTFRGVASDALDVRNT